MAMLIAGSDDGLYRISGDDWGETSVADNVLDAGRYTPLCWFEG